MRDGESEHSQPKPGSSGAIGDAPAALRDALLAAAKTLGTQPAGDPRATAALQLGWVMGSLVTSGAQTPLPSGYPIDAETVFKAKAIELPTLLARVKVEVRPPADTLIATLQTGAPAIAEALSWESSLVAALLGADVHLAKAYGVGRALNLLAYTTPVDLRAKEVTAIADVLDDLTTALPPHAGRSVGNSIRAWQRAHTPPGPEVLQAQCELWRIVLTGEKRATELLEPENYIDAAEKLAVKLRATATVLLRQYAPWVVLIAALLIGGAIVLLFVHGTASRTAAGLSSVLVALGLTWKGVGTTLGKLAGRLEAPLWGAELDGAVTEAITLGAPPPAKSRLREQRQRADGDYAHRTKRRPGIDPANRPGE
jgi:hypothetical protein